MIGSRWSRLFLAAVLGPLFLASCLSRGFDHQHADWKAIVDRHVVSDGAISWVSYSALVKEKQTVFDYISKLQAVKQESYDRFDRNQKLAFLVNAYNAFTIQQILEKYPLGSIREIEYEPGVDAWNKARYTLLGKVVSLNELENQWIRGGFQEPLIHFALVCASLGCPGLRWYSAQEFVEQATGSARAFLSDSRRNRYDAKSRTLWLSEIFDWYKSDFVDAQGSVARFVAPLVGGGPSVEASILAAEKSKKLKIRHNTYDWSLNDRK